MAPITFSATVTDIRLESRAGTAARWQITLDSTLFSCASASGTLLATSPSGSQLEILLLGVIEAGGTIWHIIDKPLAPGTKVAGRIGEARLAPE